MTEINDIVNEPLISQPAQPDIGPDGLPTPSLPEEQPPITVLPPVTVTRRCLTGYTAGVVERNQTFTDLLLKHDVSYQAMQSANPQLVPGALTAGTRYCAPPQGSRILCTGVSYVMEQGETLYTLPRTLGLSIGQLLLLNPELAPGDFLPGRVICTGA